MEKTDVECFKATKVSIFGIPCFVRNTKFIESLLSDVGMLVNGKNIVLNPERMDVSSVMIFNNILGPISLKINVCVDGETFAILMSEEPTVSMETSGHTKSESEFSSEGNGGEEVSEP